MTVSFEQPLAPGIVSDYLLEVAEYTGNGGGTDTIPEDKFVPVRGIQEITPPAVEKNLEDDGDLDSGGWGSQLATGAEYTLEGTAKVGRKGSTPDPGQAILKAAGRKFGIEGFVWWRLTSKTDGSGEMGLADASYTEQGGARTDLTLAEFTLTGRGALIDVPADTSDEDDGGDGGTETQTAGIQTLDGWAAEEPAGPAADAA